MNTAPIAEMMPGKRFVFDGVVVDTGANRLFVDGRERMCSQRALGLLRVMCESEGQLLTKQQIIDRLWPGGQIVSDEALTQAVFRARACLDRYAERLVTVRGVGLRLDASVEIQPGGVPGPAGLGAPASTSSVADLMPAAVPPHILTPATSAPTKIDRSVPDPERGVPPAAAAAVVSVDRPSRRRGALFTMVAALVIGLVSIMFWRAFVGDRHDATIDVGYGLRDSDALSTTPQTIELLRDAFRREGQGDRARGSALLETVHQSDPKTPIPAIFLSLWAIGAGNAKATDHWLEQAHLRMRDVHSPLLTALLGYAEAERSESTQEVLRYAGAVLDLREDAWQMRLARAHLLLAAGLRDASLRELKMIRIDSLAHRKMAMALADRASLGDLAGAEAALAQIEPGLPNDATLAYTRGRFAWTRGDLEAASAEFGRAVTLGNSEARFDLVNRSSINLGVIAMLAGDNDQAIRLLEQARVGMRDAHWVVDEIDSSLLLAQLHALDSETTEAQAELAEAERAAAGSNAADIRDLCQVFAARFGSDSQLARVRPNPDSEPGLDPLLAAHRALRAGDLDAARASYQLASRRIKPSSALHDEVRWLAQRLGEPVDEAMPIDPPYPPMAQFASRMALRQLLVTANAGNNSEPSR
jgi:DNA-binding winged helix-turn-helix (wHTH) protein/tetratricopeptide (TPR) repeat protein